MIEATPSTTVTLRSSLAVRCSASCMHSWSTFSGEAACTCLMLIGAQGHVTLSVPVPSDDTDIESIFNRHDNGFRLKDDVHFHLYVSTAPCGDARIFSPHDGERASKWMSE